MAHSIRTLISALVISIASLGAAAAGEDAEKAGCPVPAEYREAAFRMPMKFLETGSRGSSPQSQWILAVGEITNATPSEFENFLRTVENRRKRIMLHSPGGNLIAGMKLGLQIRQAGFTTHVGRTLKLDMEEDFPCRTLENHVENGECSSACAYAFLGGVARELSSDFFPTHGSRLGFHQFYGGLDVEVLRLLDLDTAASRTVTTTQKVVGLMASYLSELELNAGILQLALSTTPDQMNYPDYQTLLDLGVITPSTFGFWFMEPFRDGLVAASREYSPITPTQQITAYCRAETGDPVLMLTSDFSPKNVRSFLETYARPEDMNLPHQCCRLEGVSGLCEEFTFTPDRPGRETVSSQF